MSPDSDRPAPQRPLPPESLGGAPFWAATREKRLVLPWCPACDAPHWYPRGFCPTCLSEDLDWREASGEAHGTTSNRPVTSSGSVSRASRSAAT